MRKTLPFTLALLFLAACSTPPTPAPTVDVIPSATLTILPLTETPTPTATPTLIEGGMSVEQLTPYIFSKDLLDHPEKIAKMSIEELTSEEFVKGALNMLQEGKLPVPPDTAVPMSNVTLADPAKFDRSGFGEYLIADNSRIYLDTEKRPYMPGMIVETSIQDVDVYVGILVQANTDGTYALLAEFMPKRENANLLERFEGFFGVADGIYNTGLFFQDKTKCESFYSTWQDVDNEQVSSFCDFVMGMQNSDSLSRKIMNNWLKQGVLSNVLLEGTNKIYILPIIPAGSTAIKR